MFYVFNIKRLKKTAQHILILAILVLSCRFVIMPQLFPQKYGDLVERYAEKYNLESSLVYGVIYTERKFRADAISPKKAKGLMQITDGTGEWAAKSLELVDYKKDSLFEPKENIEIGCWYLNKLFNQFQGSIETALAAYNAGSGNVTKWLADSAYSEDQKTLDTIPYPETKKYVKKVMVVQKIYQMLYE